PPLPLGEENETSAAENPAEKPRETETEEEQISALLNSMSVEEKVGQLFFVRAPETGEAEAVAKWKLGGYVLFGRDFKDKSAGEIIETLASAQAASKIPLLLGVDEEGGSVVRVSSNPQLRRTKFSSPQALFCKGGMEAICAEVRERDRLLHALGINVNLAPVADVSTNPHDFIYPRSFGQDAEKTSEYVAAVVTQMKQDGMGATLKHFPGYGSNLDTHTGIAHDKRTVDSLRKADFLPFTAGIEAVDSLPASLSPALHKILREELRFEGVLMTDDLAMEAVTAYAKDGSVAVLALLAGNDLVLTTDFSTQIPQVLAAVADGTLPMETIDGALRRVLRWKGQLGLLGD
ncbi:MAG: glycoside hydrolase family 3 N-terminal domain-containing protein, partial [Ruthenibacterium sp.]